MSNITAGDEGGSFSSGNINGGEDVQQQSVKNSFHGSTSSVPSSTSNNSNGSISRQQQPPPAKKKRNLPGNPGESINFQLFVSMNFDGFL